jgi:hypothetical protein
MSDEKVRQWWIHLEDNVVLAGEPMGTYSSKYIGVIEYAAYEKLAAELAKEREISAMLREALNEIKSGGERASIHGLDILRCPTCVSAEIANQALDKEKEMRK